MNDLLNTLKSYFADTEALIKIGLSLVQVALLLFIGLWLIKKVTKLIGKALKKRNVEDLLAGFIQGLINATLKVLLFISVASLLGFDTTSLIAVLGAAGLAIGLALQGTLSNFAGGIMILLFKPFRAGDFIQTSGEMGVVSKVNLFNTNLKTVDNKTVVIPNSSIINNNLTNFTHEKKRRVDFTFGIAYGDDLKKAKEVLQRIAEENEFVIKDDAIFVGLGKLNDSSVDLFLRVWASTENYWNAYFSIQERVYLDFEREGLNIPFPQMDVHLKGESLTKA